MGNGGTRTAALAAGKRDNEHDNPDTVTFENALLLDGARSPRHLYCTAPLPDGSGLHPLQDDVRTDGVRLETRLGVARVTRAALRPGRRSSLVRPPPQGQQQPENPVASPLLPRSGSPASLRFTAVLKRTGSWIDWPQTLTFRIGHRSASSLFRNRPAVMQIRPFHRRCPGQRWPYKLLLSSVFSGSSVAREGPPIESLRQGL